jgi:hypothetical protein
MKTVLQELKDWANQYKGQMISADQVVLQAHNLLEKEKEQIIAAVDKAKNTFGDEFDFSYEFTDGEEYYNQTYNQKIPELLYKDGTPMRKVKLGKEAQELLDEVHNEKRGDLVRLLRWVLKHYSTGTDIDGMFMWENPIGKEFDSIQVVDHYLKENK